MRNETNPDVTEPLNTPEALINCIECAMKAFLKSSNVSLQEKKEHGHSGGKTVQQLNILQLL